MQVAYTTKAITALTNGKQEEEKKEWRRIEKAVRDSAVVVMLMMAHISPRGAEMLQVLSCLFLELAAASRQRDLESALPRFGQAPFGGG